MLEGYKIIAADALDKPMRVLAQDDRERMKDAANDEVVVASDDSFPASDPPSWTPVGGVGSSKRRK